MTNCEDALRSGMLCEHRVEGCTSDIVKLLTYDNSLEMWECRTIDTAKRKLLANPRELKPVQYEDGSQLAKPGYHLSEIPHGVFGDVSKILEEAHEVKDAADQGVRVMVLVELSDLVGAIQGYLDKHEPGMKISDLQAMAEVTHRAFENGSRKAK